MMAPITYLVAGTATPPTSARPTTVSHHRKPWRQWPALLLVLLCFVCRTIALSPDPPLPVETLELDTRAPYFEKGSWVMLSREEHEMRNLAKRSESAPPVTTTFQIAVSTVTEASTTSTVPASPLPSPLDSSLSSNFSGENGNRPCPAFINSFLTNPTFKQCYPFSLLLQGSRSFFEAEKSLVSITQVLDASCSADVSFCSSYMTELAKNLTDSSNCGDDYELGNSVVVQAYIAMVSYQTVYSSTCLKDGGTAMYCYANAVTNLTTPSNVYFYYLPLNISLPGSSIPACSWCLERTMGIFQSASANRKLPISNTYVSAAKQINAICGPEFVNDTLPNAIVLDSGNVALTSGPQWLLMVLPLLLALEWLL